MGGSVGGMMGQAVRTAAQPISNSGGKSSGLGSQGLTTTQAPGFNPQQPPQPATQPAAPEGGKSSGLGMAGLAGLGAPGFSPEQTQTQPNVAQGGMPPQVIPAPGQFMDGEVRMPADVGMLPPNPGMVGKGGLPIPQQINPTTVLPGPFGVPGNPGFPDPRMQQTLPSMGAAAENQLGGMPLSRLQDLANQLQGQPASPYPRPDMPSQRPINRLPTPAFTQQNRDEERRKQHGGGRGLAEMMELIRNRRR